MKKALNILILFFLSFIPLMVLSQQEQTNDQKEEEKIQRDPKAREKIEAARIGMITNKLGLTPAQAEKFWPIYREFAEKRMELRKEFRSEKAKVNPEKATPEQQKRLVDLGFNIKQRELDLERSYSGRLLNVITADQMLNLHTAERDFQRMLIDQLQQRREMQQRRENLRNRNQNLREKRN